MEKLNKDELFTLALHLDLPSLLSFCSSNKNIERNVCQRDDIWIYKLKKDFPDYKNLKVEKSFKDLYKILYSLSQLKTKLKRRESIYELSNLEALSLDNNKLTQIPKEIEALSNLQVLNLSNNKLTSIPKEITENKNLKIYK